MGINAYKYPIHQNDAKISLLFQAKETDHAK